MSSIVLERVSIIMFLKCLYLVCICGFAYCVGVWFECQKRPELNHSVLAVNRFLIMDASSGIGCLIFFYISMPSRWSAVDEEHVFG